MPKPALLFIPAFVLCLILLKPKIVLAMTNDDYQLQLLPLNQSQTPQQNKEENPSTGVQSTGDGTLGLAIDNDLLSFDMLSPTNPLVRTNTITASGTIPYQVFIEEDHELANDKNGQIIPDTTCDDGSCSETTASLWTNPLTYGFGYACKSENNTNCINTNLSSTFFQIPNLAKNKTPQVLMDGISKQQLQLLYKVNISGTQSTGNYHNTITYFAVPAY